MPDPVSDSPWMDKAKAVCLVIAALSAGIPSIIAAWYSARNSDKAIHVIGQNDTLLEHQAANTERLTSIENKADSVAQKVVALPPKVADEVKKNK